MALDKFFKAAQNLMENQFLSPIERCSSPLQLGEVPDLCYSAYGDESAKSSPSPSIVGSTWVIPARVGD